MSNSSIASSQSTGFSMHPQKFALWLFIVTVVMVFASLTSAYIVRQAEGNWLDFDLPSIFWISSLMIALSSVSFQWAYAEAKKDEFTKVRIGLSITLILGLAFMALQFAGWDDLVDMEVFFVGNPAGSFVYVITGVHLAHIVSSLIFLLVVLIQSSRMKVHSKSMDSMDMCITYWHFLGGLWLYLFLFLVLNR